MVYFADLWAQTWAYLIFLPYSVSSSLSLQVILRIPVTVKNDDCVSSGQVYAETSRPSGKEETEVPWALSIEVVHSLPS